LFDLQKLPGMAMNGHTGQFFVFQKQVKK